MTFLDVWILRSFYFLPIAYTAITNPMKANIPKDIWDNVIRRLRDLNI